MTKPQHTPTPWRMKMTSADLILSPSGQAIALPRHKADAQFIVRAVNNHDALVEALGALAMAARAQVDDRTKIAAGIPAHDPNRSIPEARGAQWQRLYDKAEIALRQAKGE